MMRSRRRQALVVGVAMLLAGVGPAEATAPAAPPERAVALGTPVFSMRRVPAALSRLVADTHLGSDLDRVLADPALAGARDRSCLVVGEHDVADGEVTHYSRRPTLALIPASTLKLITTAAALAQLGPEARFTTEVKAGAPLSDGTVGEVFLVGGGDPLLSTANFAVDGGYMGQPRRTTSMETLADQVVAAGVRGIGRILGDESRYDAERLVPSWNPRYIANFDISPLSALVVNKAFTSATPPAVAISPPAHAASVLAGLLRARGVTVGGTGTGPAPTDAKVLTSIESAPLREVVAEVLQNSDNMAAEMLVKEMAARPGTPGTTAAGLSAVADQIRRMAGTNGEEIATVDGSGLDRGDRLSCSLLQRVLALAGDAGPLAQGLPTAGRNGTLFRRFLGTAAAGKVRAKTGSLEGVSSLTGFATGRDGRTLTFSLLANELPSASAGTALQDKVVNLLAGYPRGPTAAELGPRPVRPPSG